MKERLAGRGSRNRISALAPLLVPLLALACGALASSAPAAATPRDRAVRAGESSKIVLPGRVHGFRRSYRLHVPTGSAESPRPLVVALHGGLATASIFERQSNFSRHADRHGFVVAYPNGIGIFSALRHWNGGFCCAKAMKSGVDDVAFVDRVIEDVASRVEIDRDRIYVVGYSNGGMLAYLYAAQRGSKVAGVGIFASSIGLEGGPGAWLPPPPEVPVPLTIFHGLDDERLPIAGRAGRSQPDLRTIGPEASARFWAMVNGCDGSEESTDQPWGRSLLWCGEGPHTVRLDLLEGWGHDWPGPRFTDRLPADHPLHGYDAGARMWDFFESLAR